MINLNEFVGKAVTIQIEDGRNIDGFISFNEGNYPYRFTSYDSKYLCHYNVNGFLWTDESPSPYNIRGICVKIQTEEQQWSGIAQGYPNIDLSKFDGQKSVYAIWSNGKKTIGPVSFEGVGYDWKVADYVQISFDGKLTDEIYIKEIYGEGAYSINTKHIFDPTNADYQRYLELKSKFEKKRLSTLN